MTDTALDPDAIDLNFIPRFRDPIAAIPVEDEGVLYEEDTGNLHQLDPIAATICAFVDGQTSLQTAVDELSGAFGADPEVVANDVLAMVRELGSKGLLDGVAAAETKGVAR